MQQTSAYHISVFETGKARSKTETVLTDLLTIENSDFFGHPKVRFTPYRLFTVALVCQSAVSAGLLKHPSCQFRRTPTRHRFIARFLLCAGRKSEIYETTDVNFPPLALLQPSQPGRSKHGRGNRNRGTLNLHDVTPVTSKVYRCIFDTTGTSEELHHDSF